MEQIFKSTRGGEKRIKSSQGILKGISSDGGLYVPEIFPSLKSDFDKLKGMNYKECAFYILKKYFVDFTDDELKECIDKAYDSKFSSEEIISLAAVENIYFLELYHGKTLAFKDMALSILPHLIKCASDKSENKKEIVILTATSGDTGKAALEGFANVNGIKIIVFYPEKGISEVQKRQMQTQEGKNTFVIGVNGNFDDAQRAIKEVLNDDEFKNLLEKNDYMFSSANSINIGRLIPQIVYYVYSYFKLLRENRIDSGEEINIVVPTGNFGNILAAYYSKKMGLPIDKLICASNENNVLTDFINTGIYDCERNFLITNSPSMDILISSNLERFLYDISGQDSKVINKLMKDLKENSKYEINDYMKSNMKDLYGDFANDNEVLKGIKEIYEECNYLIDTHTSVGYMVYKKYKEKTGDNKKTIIASTASPFKFTKSINDALELSDENDEFKLIKELSEIIKIEIPKGVKDLEDKEKIHNEICNKDEIKNVIKNILKA